MTKTTRCLLCVALICAIALLLPAVRAQAEGENPTYAYDSATKTLTITPGTSGLIGKEIQNESDYYSKWTKEVEKVIIAGDIRGIGTIGEDHNLVDGVFLTWRKLKEVEYQGKIQFYVGDYAFYACGELASFPLEWAVDFGYGAMMQSALEEVKIPHLQGNIGDCAFWLITPLKTVDITIENGQNRNTYIGTKAFASDYSRVLEEHPEATADRAIKVLEACQVEEEDFFCHVTHKTWDVILHDIRKAHENDNESAPDTTPADELIREVQKAMQSPGDRVQQFTEIFCKAFRLKYKRLSQEERSLLKKLFKKSPLIKQSGMNFRRRPWK